MAITVSLINMKGGVGKSTLTFNLAWASKMAGKKVLVVDLDPQFNVSQYLMGDHQWSKFIDSGGKTVYDIFEEFSPSLDRKRSRRLATSDVVSKSTRLEWRGKGALHVIPSRLELSWTLRHPTSKEHLLSRMLNKVHKDYDLILIDCAPTESIFTVAAYLASNYVLVPVRPEFLSTIGLPLLARSLAEFGVQYSRRSPQVAGVVINMADEGRGEYWKSLDDIRHVAQTHGWHVFSTTLRDSESYRKGPREGTFIRHTDYAR